MSPDDVDSQDSAPPPPRGMDQPPMYGPPMRRPGGLFSVKIIAALLLVGVILFYIDGMVCIAAQNTDQYDTDEYEDKIDDRYGAMTVYKVGLLIMSVGGLLALIALVGGAIMNKDIDTRVRAAMIAMAIALLILIVIIILISPGMRTAVGPY